MVRLQALKHRGWGAAAMALVLSLLAAPGCFHFPPPVEEHNPYFDNSGKTGPDARRAADRFFHSAEAQVKDIRDVTADLTRQEVIGGRLQDAETIRWVQRVEPHSLHLRWWTGAKFDGRELVYVDGANDGKVLVNMHLPGVLGRVQGVTKLSPDSSLLNQRSRYSIKEVGYESLVKRIFDNYDAAARRDTLSVGDFGTHEHNGYLTRAFEVVLDYPEKPQADYHSMVVWFDAVTGLPVHFVGMDANGKAVEDYLWKGLKFNQDLTDADFVMGGTTESREEPKAKPAEPETKPAAPAPKAPTSPGEPGSK